jgi:hypothetical protein
MTPTEFVQALKLHCRDAAVEDSVSLLQTPPGRRPNNDVMRSEWFRALSPHDRELVILAMRQVADATLFGVLCVIDGVRSIESKPEKSVFHVSAKRSGNESHIAPGEVFLHDILRAEP